MEKGELLMNFTVSKSRERFVKFSVGVSMRSFKHGALVSKHGCINRVLSVVFGTPFYETRN